MRLGTRIAAAGLVAAMSTGIAQAAPLGAATATLQTAVDTGPAPQIELVRGGCGFGEHRSWYGRCHYNRGWRGRARYRHNHWRYHY